MPELRIVLTVVALVAAMVLAGALGVRQRSGALILALLGFVWLTLDNRFEGAVLLTVSDHNGLTAADLVGLAGIGAAGFELFRLRRSRQAPVRAPQEDLDLRRS